ncbi:unnamed protein product [Closterium sp. Naga37s-1]|nr:unnamed protein product [Closterium sp. Naga37s-1]
MHGRRLQPALRSPRVLQSRHVCTAAAPLVSLVLLALASFGGFGSVQVGATPFSVYDSYQPPCPFLPDPPPQGAAAPPLHRYNPPPQGTSSLPPFLPDPPPKVVRPPFPQRHDVCPAQSAGRHGWKRWSDPATWTNGGSSVIPGVKATGGEWADVTIPCGTAVLLDVPLVSLNRLVIKGWLRVLDSPSLPRVEVQAAFIIVQGRLSAGSTATPFSRLALFTLLPSPSRANFTLTDLAPADPLNPRNLGHKAFIVVGGAVDLHGMPGSSSAPAWVRMARTVAPGDKFLLVDGDGDGDGDGDVTQWPVGGAVDLHGMPGSSSAPAWVRLARTVAPGDKFVVVDGDVTQWPVGGAVDLHGMPGSSSAPAWVRLARTVGGAVDLHGMPGSSSAPAWVRLARTVGGAVDLHGMPGSSSAPAWVRLARTVAPGDKFVVVDGDVTQWPVGGTVAVASTSANMNEAETGVITYVAPMPSGGGFYVGLAKALRRSLHGVYNTHTTIHRGDSVPGPGQQGHAAGAWHSLLFLCAPLTFPPASPSLHGVSNAHTTIHRGGSVQFLGLGNQCVLCWGAFENSQKSCTHFPPPLLPFFSFTFPSCIPFTGGHFMVFMTKTPQFIEGVQFLGLGNQGTLGRYPLHFHICGDNNQAHVVRKNVIAASNQRCVVIHATSDVTIEENVAYETKGHCFITEEGSEYNNVFKRNLGINIRGVRKVIPPGTSDRLDRQSDNQATAFWMASRPRLILASPTSPLPPSTGVQVRKVIPPETSDRLDRQTDNQATTCWMAALTLNLYISSLFSLLPPPVRKVIPPESSDRLDRQTDNQATTFWMASGPLHPSVHPNPTIHPLSPSTPPVRKVISPETSDRLDRQTDNQATTFWMASPRNDLIGNVAAGCDNTGQTDNQTTTFWYGTPLMRVSKRLDLGGTPHLNLSYLPMSSHVPPTSYCFWYEMLARMRGASKRLDLGDTPMPFFDSFGKFDGNVAHSCKAGVRMYPHGNRPPKERLDLGDTPMPFFDSFGKFDGNVAHSCKAGVRMYPHGNRPPKESLTLDAYHSHTHLVLLALCSSRPATPHRSPAKQASGAASTKAVSAAVLEA